MHLGGFLCGLEHLEFLKPGKLVKELLVRTRSWWIMCACFIATTLAHPVVTVIGLAFLSYALLREMYPLLKLDQRERNVALLCYAVIPVQYALAYLGMTTLFLAFIPVFMFVAIPFMLVVRGETQGIVRSISLMPYSLVAWVYGMSHLAMLFNLPELPGFTAGPQGLLLYLIFLVGINDVLQFGLGQNHWSTRGAAQCQSQQDVGGTHRRGVVRHPHRGSAPILDAASKRGGRPSRDSAWLWRALWVMRSPPVSNAIWASKTPGMPSPGTGGIWTGWMGFRRRRPRFFTSSIFSE